MLATDDAAIIPRQCPPYLYAAHCTASTNASTERQYYNIFLQRARFGSAMYVCKHMRVYR